MISVLYYLCDLSGERFYYLWRVASVTGPTSSYNNIPLYGAIIRDKMKYPLSKNT